MPQDKKQIKASGLMKPKPSVSAYRATKEDSAFSKRSGIPFSEIKAQGGVTPQSVSNQIKKTGGYFTKYGPGANKNKKK